MIFEEALRIQRWFYPEIGAAAVSIIRVGQM